MCYALSILFSSWVPSLSMCFRLGLTFILLCFCAPVWAAADGGTEQAPDSGAPEQADAPPPATKGWRYKVPSERPSGAVELLGAGGGGYTQLINVWDLRRRALKDDKDEERAAELVERVRRLRRDAGIRRLDGFGISLVREALEASEEGDAKLAAKRLEQAELLAPGLPELLDARARVAMQTAPWALHTWISTRIKAASARFADFQRRMLFLSDLVLTLVLLLIPLGLLFLAGQSLRYGLHVYHDLGVAFPSMMKFVLIAAGGLMLAVPLFYGFGPFLFVFPLAAVLWAYQATGERVLTAFFVLMLGAAPWVLRMADRLSEAGTGTAQAIHALGLNPSDNRALEIVAQRVASSPTDQVAKAALGLAYKRQARMKRAAPLLAEAATRAKDKRVRGVAANNLGNLWFATGRAKTAAAAYEKARGLLPTALAPPFNLYRLYHRTGKNESATAALGAASSIDAKRVAEWNADEDRHLNRYVVDLEIPADVLVERSLTQLFAPTAFSSRAWQVFAGPIPELAAPFAASLTLALFGLITMARKRMHLSWPCDRCGRPADWVVPEGRPEDPLCEQCLNLFVRNVPVDRRVRFEKEEAIGRYTSMLQWGTRAAGIVFPGFVSVLMGRVFRGLLLGGISLLLVLRLILPEGLLFEPVPSASGGLEFWALAAALAMLWAHNGWRTWRAVED